MDPVIVLMGSTSVLTLILLVLLVIFSLKTGQARADKVHRDIRKIKDQIEEVN